VLQQRVPIVIRDRRRCSNRRFRQCPMRTLSDAPRMHPHHSATATEMPQHRASRIELNRASDEHAQRMSGSQRSQELPPFAKTMQVVECDDPNVIARARLVFSCGRCTVPHAFQAELIRNSVGPQENQTSIAQVVPVEACTRKRPAGSGLANPMRPRDENDPAALAQQLEQYAIVKSRSLGHKRFGTPQGSRGPFYDRSFAGSDSGIRSPTKPVPGAHTLRNPDATSATGSGFLPPQRRPDRGYSALLRSRTPRAGTACRLSELSGRYASCTRKAMISMWFVCTSCSVVLACRAAAAAIDLHSLGHRHAGHKTDS
jgi:hypothetical protein